MRESMALRSGTPAFAGMVIAVLILRRRSRLSKVMDERGKHQVERLCAAPPPRAGRHRMHIGVALGMIFRILAHADECRQLLKPDLQRTGAAQNIKIDFRIGTLHKCLFRFAHHARGRKRIRRHAAHFLHRRLVHRQVIARGELRPKDSAEAGLPQIRARNGANFFKSALTAERIDDFAGQRIAQNRVDGEIRREAAFSKDGVGSGSTSKSP